VGGVQGVAALIALLGGCLWGKGLAACDAYGDPIAREECRYDEVKKVMSDPTALDAALAHIADEASHDLVLYRLAVDNPDRASELCRRTRTAAMQDKCAKVIGRPHLNSGPPR